MIAWIGVAVITITLYFVNYSWASGGVGCFSKPGSTGCSYHFALANPGKTFTFTLALFGNVLSTTPVQEFLPTTNLLLREILGAVCLVGSVFIAVQCIRRRRSEPMGWIPLSLLVTGVAWYGFIVFGRVSTGIASASASHYTTPQLFVLTGIAMWLSGQALHRSRTERTPTGRMYKWKRLAPLVLLAFVAGLTVFNSATNGLGTARDVQGSDTYIARTIVNIDRIPAQQRGCYLAATVGGGLISSNNAETYLYPEVLILKHNHLSTFSPSAYAYYRKLGPVPFSFCK